MCDFLKKHFKKPELIPLIFIISATIMLIYLGMWQVQRLEWKSNLIKQVEQAQELPLLDKIPENLENLEYQKVSLTGVFKYENALHMIGRQHGNFPGYFIVTPFELENDGRIILVNRGFSPSGKESRPEGLQIIKGVIRPARTKRFFAPENLPEKNIWFYENVPAMSKATNLSLSSLIVEQVGKTKRGSFPILGDGKIYMKNDHLGYAISWFSTAIIGLVMFGFYYRKKENS